MCRSVESACVDIRQSVAFTDVGLLV